MKILFLNPPTDEISDLRVEPYSVGLLTLYTMALNAGYYAEIKYMTSMLEISIINFADYDILALPCYTAQREFVFRILSYAKNLNRKIVAIIGGPHVTGIEERILRYYPQCDFVITGQADICFVDLLRSIEFGCKDLFSISNLTWKSGNSVNKNNASYFMNLEKIPVIRYPDEYFMLYGSYMKDFRVFGENKRGALSFSRGCNYNCTFCVNVATFGRQRYVPIENTKQQINELICNKGVKNFYVTDENFCADSETAMKISEYLISLNEPLIWNCSVRGDHIDLDLLTVMNKAGCNFITVGIESGAQSVLDRIKKDYNVDGLISSLRQVRQMDMELRITINLGFETTENELSETAQIINEIQPQKMQIYYFMVYPGTELYDICKTEKLLSDDYWFSGGNTVPYFTLYKSEEDNTRDLKKLYQKIKAKKIFTRDCMESQTISLIW